MTTGAQPNEPSRHEPTLEADRVLMVDLATTRAQAKGAAPSDSRKWGPNRDRCDCAPKCATTTPRRWGGQDVSSAGGNPHHCHHTTGGVCQLVPN
jgi:hypothetical protein